MKTKLKFLVIVLTLFTVVFYSCEEEKEKDPTTVKQDKENIKTSLDAVVANLEQIKNGTLYDAVFEFLNIRNGEALNADWAENMAEQLEKVIDFDNVFSNDRFNYSRLSGKYTWNRSSQTWSKTSNSTPLALFPSSKTTTTNNCELNITAYTDKQVQIDGEAVYLPTSANFYLKKDNSKIVSLDLSASYNSNGIPTAADVELYLSPATVKVSSSRKTDSKYSFAVSLANDNNKENAFSVETEVTFSAGINSYDDLYDTGINTVKLTLSQGKLGIEGTADVKTLADISDDITADDLNRNINLKLSFDGQQIGTLKAKEVRGDFAVFIVYKDGTEENTSIYYEDFLEDLESFFESTVFMDAKEFKSALKKQIIKVKTKNIKQRIVFWKN